MGKLDGKITIITGATSGIGRCTAEAFVNEGAQVLITGRRQKEGNEIAEELGERCEFMATDVTLENDVKAMIDHMVAKHGRLDCLFNNAGAPAPSGRIEEIPLDGFEAALKVLLSSVFLGMKHAAPVMRRQKSGSIINNGSVAARRAGLSSSMTYGCAKAAVVQLSCSVAMELGEDSVRVNTISPGGIATGIFGKVMGLDDTAAEGTVEVVKVGLAAMQPIPRSGMPEDIAHAAVFLASDDSSFINGHDLVIDGGVVGGRMWSPQQESLQQMRTAFGIGDTSQHKE